MAIRSDKKMVQDIVPSPRRTIRNLSMEEEVAVRPAPRGRKVSLHIRETEVDAEEQEIPSPRFQSRPDPRPRRSRRLSGTLITFGIIFVCIAVIAVALSLLYSKAVVTITPKVAPIEINGTFTAKKSPQSSGLVYEVVTTKSSATAPVAATDGPYNQTKAKGTAFLYNEQTTSQKLVPGTRLSNAKGLIYRTSATLVIPAAKMTGGKLVPGSISAAIVADQAGAEYNMLLSDLTGDLNVVAYKGGDKYTKVYGRIKTDITGGFLGNKKIISTEARTAAVSALQASLKEKVTKELLSLVPQNSLLYDGATTFEYQTSDVAGKAVGTAEVSVTATGYGVYFKPEAFIKSIGAKELERFPVPSYETKGLNELNFTIVNTKDFSAQKGTPLIFSLKGNVSLVGVFPENTLKNELKGISLEESNAVFAKYPAIGSAHALITPFWMRAFPNSAEKIILEIKSE